MSNHYTKHVNPRGKGVKTPQSEPIPGREADMKQNNAGGFTFTISDWDRLDRFLILGVEGNTYYTTERKLTQDAAKSVQKCIDADGLRVVNRVVEVSDAGRAPKNDPALFVLAMCSADGNEATRRAALAALPKVARIGTHLMHYAEFVQAFRGWGRALRRGVGDWYNSKSVEDLTYQLMKYKSRDGWSNRDLLRLSHPQTDDVVRNTLYKWVTKPDSVDLNSFNEGPLARLAAAERLARETDATAAVKLIADFNLPRETVNTALLNDVKIWEALLDKMPVTALVRNLGKMTAIGLLKPLSAASVKVVAMLGNAEAIAKSRIHPLALLVAMNTYRAGRGVEGSLTWTPDQNIVNALDKAFYLAFKNVPATGKRWLLGLDVSGSMEGGLIAGLPGITPRVASAAMALVTMATEQNTYAMGFTAGSGPSRWGMQYGSGLTALDISPRQRLDKVCEYIRSLPMGGTDCALPILHATKEKLDVDAFVVYTDNETWAGSVQPVQALREYRQKTGIPAKLIVVGMTVTDFTIADPTDAGMLDVVGFDTAAPAIMADFVGFNKKE